MSEEEQGNKGNKGHQQSRRGFLRVTSAAAALPFMPPLGGAASSSAGSSIAAALSNDPETVVVMLKKAIRIEVDKRSPEVLVEYYSATRKALAEVGALSPDELADMDQYFINRVEQVHDIAIEIQQGEVRIKGAKHENVNADGAGQHTSRLDNSKNDLHTLIGRVRSHKTNSLGRGLVEPLDKDYLENGCVRGE